MNPSPNSEWDAPGSGSAFRSSFANAVNGSRSSSTITCGTMYSGNNSPTCCRNSPALISAPAAFTT
jgi:hypothetical protein